MKELGQSESSQRQENLNKIIGKVSRRSGFVEKNNQNEQVICLELVSSSATPGSTKKKIATIVGPNLSVGKKNCDINIEMKKDFPSDIFFIFEDSGEMVLLKSLHPELQFKVNQKDFRGVRSLILEENDRVDFYGETLVVLKVARNDEKVMLMVPKRYQSELAQQILNGQSHHKGEDFVSENELAPPPLPAEDILDNELKFKSAEDFLQDLEREVQMTQAPSEMVIDVEEKEQPKKVEKKTEMKSEREIPEKTKINGVHPLRRVLALFYDALFVSLILFNIPIEMFFNPFFDLMKTIFALFQNPILEKIDLVLACHVILLWLFFHIWRMLGNLFCGASFGQLAAGMRGGDTFLWNRVGGIFREFLSIFLSPFFVFDIPALFRKRTFKEILSLTNFKNYSLILSSMVAVFFIFGVFVLSLLAPLMVNQKDKMTSVPYTDSSKIMDENKGHPLPPEEKSQISTFMQFSRLLKDESIPNVTDSDLLMLPQFEISQNANKGKIYPWIKLYSPLDKTNGSFKVLHRSNWLGFVKNEMKQLFALRYFYPHLSRFFEQETAMDLETWNEFKKVIAATFMVDEKSIFKNFYHWGPYSYCFQHLRENLGKLLGINRWDSVKANLKTIGDHNFLEIENQVKGENWHYFVPMTGDSALIYALGTHGENNLSEKFWNQEKYQWNFFFNASDYTQTKVSNLDYDFLFQRPLSFFQILDLYSIPDLKDEQRKMLQDFVLVWSQDKALKLLEKAPLDKELKNLYIDFFDNIISTAQIVVKFHPEKEKFLKNMEQLKLGTIQEDKLLIHSLIESTSSFSPVPAIPATVGP